MEVARLIIIQAACLKGSGIRRVLAATKATHGETLVPTLEVSTHVSIMCGVLSASTKRRGLLGETCSPAEEPPTLARLGTLAVNGPDGPLGLAGKGAKAPSMTVTGPTALALQRSHREGFLKVSRVDRDSPYEGVANDLVAVLVSLAISVYFDYYRAAVATTVISAS